MFSKKRRAIDSYKMRNREYKEMKKAFQYTEHIIVNKV